MTEEEVLRQMSRKTVSRIRRILVVIYILYNTCLQFNSFSKLSFVFYENNV